MPRATSQHIPKLRLHKATGQGYVVIDGQFRYFGRYDAPATQQRYHRLIAEWIENGRRLPVAPEEISIAEVCAAYLAHASKYYRDPNGTPTGAMTVVLAALRALREVYGDSVAVDFGPRALRTLQNRWVLQGLARRTINHYAAQVKRIFRWAASREMVPATVCSALSTVEGLRGGRSAAKETEPVRPVSDAHVEAVLPHLSVPVVALVRLQTLTGARPGELLRLRPIDLDTSGEVWSVRLENHKTRYRGRDREILLGPRAQAILRPFLTTRPLDAYLFSPREAERARYEAAPTHRRANQVANPAKTERQLGDCYTPDSYRRAIERVCTKAGVPLWTPHQLRHTAATRIRKEFGLEAAQIMLGHVHANVTEVYAETDRDKALVVARAMG